MARKLMIAHHIDGKTAWVKGDAGRFWRVQPRGKSGIELWPKSACTIEL